MDVLIFRKIFHIMEISRLPMPVVGVAESVQKKKETFNMSIFSGGQLGALGST